MRRIVTAAALLGITACLAGLPARAEIPISRIRATNLARMEAERLNGGLQRYFAAGCMHQRGGGDCLVEQGPDGYLFNFLGGPPGWETKQEPATVETRILIAPDGTRVVTVEYNGAPR
jgi:hypothetical protein